MRFTRCASSALVLLVLGSLPLSLSCATQERGQLVEVDPVQRGQYLTTIMGCNDCHTPGMMYGQPDMQRTLSGSELGWAGPWGVAFAGNLTPDEETGIGRWSDDEIITAIRIGQRPDGRMLAPAMPYPNYSLLAEEDARAIVAFLRSLPPIPHQNPAPVPPGEPYAGAIITMPAPPAWDVPAPPGP
jgi:mono/diheme cytochrome c family protein